MIDSAAYRLQLQAPAALVPVAAYGAPGVLAVDPNTGYFKQSNIYDKIEYFNRSAIEYLQFGYGDMCYVYDSMIDPINRVMRGESPVIPTALKRLLSQVPNATLTKYFPLFAQGKLDFTTHTFEELDPNCNPGCKPSPYFQRYNDTENGRRQNTMYRYNLDYDMYDVIQKYQINYYNLNRDLNRVGYCNPAVNT